MPHLPAEHRSSIRDLTLASAAEGVWAYMTKNNGRVKNSG